MTLLISLLKNENRVTYFCDHLRFRKVFFLVINEVIYSTEMYEVCDHFFKRGFISLLLEIDLSFSSDDVICLLLQIGFMLRCVEFAVKRFRDLGIEYVFDDRVDSLKINDRFYVLDIDQRIQITRCECTTVFGRDREGFNDLLMYDKMLELHMVGCVKEFLIEEKLKRILIEGLEVEDGNTRFSFKVYDCNFETLERSVICTIYVEEILREEVKESLE
jgi:hypothetical protein